MSMLPPTRRGGTTEWCPGSAGATPIVPAKGFSGTLAGPNIAGARVLASYFQMLIAGSLNWSASKPKPGIFAVHPQPPYNVRLLAAPPDLAPHPLRQALAAVLRHHDGLRSRFTRQAGSWTAAIAGDSDALPLAWIDATALPVDARVSHPNDVMVEGRKIAGILPEASTGRVRLGIGVNVNETVAELPEDTVKPATSLRIETGREWERAPLVAAILLELENRYDAWQQR